MQLVDEKLLDIIIDDAKKNQRLRMNYNFHESPDSKSQRLLNALEPGTLLPIHRHCFTSETYILLKGHIKVIFYNNQKEIIKSVVLDTSKKVYGVNIPIGQWHTIDVLESGSVIFEVKDGPYTPLTEIDILKI